MLEEIYSEIYKNLTEKYLDMDVRKLALQKNALKDIDSQFFIEQLALLQRSKNKLPTYYGQRCIFTSKSLQQSTLEAVAFFRASLFEGQRCIDFTGGLGSDDFAFSRSFKEVISIDPDNHLNEIVRINFEKLGVHNILRINGSAEGLWEQMPEADLVFLDPDRRPADASRHHALEQLNPDITQLYPKINHKYRRILTKISPLFDVRELARTFNNISDIWCIAYRNEMKEVCFLIDKNQISGTTRLHAVNITEGQTYIYSAESATGANFLPEMIKIPQAFFLEPNHAMIHSGLWKLLAHQNHFSLIHPDTPLLFNDKIISGEFGRAFRVAHALPYKKDDFKEYLEAHKIKKANLSFRGSRLINPESLFQKYKLKQGGEDYFFFPESSDGKPWFIHGIKT